MHHFLAFRQGEATRFCPVGKRGVRKPGPLEHLTTTNFWSTPTAFEGRSSFEGRKKRKIGAEGEGGGNQKAENQGKTWTGKRNLEVNSCGTKVHVLHHARVHHRQYLISCKVACLLISFQGTCVCHELISGVLSLLPL